MKSFLATMRHTALTTNMCTLKLYVNASDARDEIKCSKSWISLNHINSILKASSKLGGQRKTDTDLVELNAQISVDSSWNWAKSLCRKISSNSHDWHLRKSEHNFYEPFIWIEGCLQFDSNERSFVTIKREENRIAIHLIFGLHKKSI